MSNTQARGIDTVLSPIAVGETRLRQTERPSSPFRDVLAGGVGLLVAGAEVATTVVGGPILAAAVRGAGGGALRGIAAGGAGGDGAAPAGSGVAGGASSAAGDRTDLASAEALQRESQAFNLRLLALQEEIQQENRSFTTLSNVLRAKHDTAKAALSNIRS